MERITLKILNNQAVQLNRLLKPKTGKLAFDFAYGGVRLVLIENNSGHHNIFDTGYISKRALSDILSAINSLLLKKDNL